MKNQESSNKDTPKSSASPLKDNIDRTPMRMGGIIFLAVLQFALLIFAIYCLIIVWPEQASREPIEKAIREVTEKITAVDSQLEMDVQDQAKLQESIIRKSQLNDSLRTLYDNLATVGQSYEYSKSAYLFGTKIKYVKLDVIFFLIVICGAVLGSITRSIYSFVYRWYYGKLYRSWFMAYALRPVYAAALALIVYFLIRGGLLNIPGSFNKLNPFGVAGLSGIVGLFTEEVVRNLRQLVNTLFSEKAPIPGSPQDTPTEKESTTSSST